MLRKIKTKTKNLASRAAPYVKSLRDVRVLGFLGVAAIALLVAWNIVSVIQINHELQRRIVRLERENKLQELENANLRLRNQYLATDHYLDLQARRLLGKAAPGETVILVPESVALAHSRVLPEAALAEEPAEPSRPAYQRNFKAWLEFLFGRGAKDI
jgi:cell division protein FtsB